MLLVVIGLAACGGGDGGARRGTTAGNFRSLPVPVHRAALAFSRIDFGVTVLPGGGGWWRGGTVMGSGGPPSGSGIWSSSTASPTTRSRSRRTWWGTGRVQGRAIDTTELGGTQYALLVYLKGNRVYRLDLRRGTWPPASARFIADGEGNCGAAMIHDVRNAERSWIDLTVRDDRQSPMGRAFRHVGGSPPSGVASEVVGAMRASDGAIIGFVDRRWPPDP